MRDQCSGGLVNVHAKRSAPQYLTVETGADTFPKLSPFKAQTAILQTLRQELLHSQLVRESWMFDLYVC